jgi:Tetratricopeptide repeat-like domain
MTTPATPSDANQAAIPLSSEERLRNAWSSYGSLVYIACAVVAVGILAKGGWDYLNTQKEVGIKKDFAECLTPDAYRTFINNHPGHVLTGVAELIIANDAYSGGKFSDAAAGYGSAVADLPAGPAQANARIGLAMALAQTGKTGEAESSLRLIMNDPVLLKTTRTEAGYHLAELSLADGRGADVQKIAEQLMQIDPSSPFSERAFTLRVPLASTLTVPGVTAKP